MQVFVRDLLNREVHDANGASVGRVTDVVVNGIEGQLQVTALKVGSWALLHRLGLFRGRVPEVPWDQVYDLGPPLLIRSRQSKLPKGEGGTGTWSY